MTQQRIGQRSVSQPQPQQGYSPVHVAQALPPAPSAPTPPAPAGQPSATSGTVHIFVPLSGDTPPTSNGPTRKLERRFKR